MMDGANKPAISGFSFAAGPAFAMLDATVARFGGRPAVDFLGKSFSWARIGQLADAAAAGLQRLGVGKGVNVGLCLPNCPYFVVMYYAILKAGGTVVNFNPLYTEREIEAQARAAEVTVMVTIDLALVQDKISALAARGVFRHVVSCSFAAALPVVKGLAFRWLKRGELAKAPAGATFISFAALTGGAKKPAAVAIDPARDVAALQFTGGTTGVPKAAMLSHENISVNVAQLLAMGLPLEAGQERILCILPLFHVYAMTAVMNLGVVLGAELLLLPRLDMKTLLSTIFRRRPTVMPGVPTLFTAITRAAEQRRDHDMSFIKYCTSGGAPIAAETATRFEQMSHCRILEGYGLSETSPVATATPPDRVKRGSVGTALPGTVIEIRDPENPGTVLAQGERGEICLGGPQVFLGYYKQPAETEAAFVDGMFRTGDIGYLDAEGYLFIVDRIKDLILCGGYNVYPRSIEEAAYQHPAVLEAVAIGVPDEYRGQAPKLFVVLREGEQVDGAALKLFLAEYLSKIELPREVEIRDSLPKTMVGKHSKKELVAEEAAKAKASS
jgi:long-chain acyl-CoA synthetase